MPRPLVILVCLLWATPSVAAEGSPTAPAGVALATAYPDGDDLAPSATSLPNLRIGVMHTWSAIDHDLSSGGELRRRIATATISWRALDSLVLGGDVGAITSGDLTVDEQRHRVEPGPRAGLGGTWRVMRGDGYLPYIQVGASFAVLSSTTVGDDGRERLTALDFRTEAIVGKLFGGAGRAVGPYLVGRSVTGGLYWKYKGRARSVRPDDAYQLGLGITAHQGELDAFVEVAPLGARSVTAGLGYAF